MLTKSGVKLLDFGLAKLKGDSSTNAGLSQAPTRDMSLTAEGTILGTLQYMAPEQLEGHEADSRTDIFAFGAVVYEMITGKKPFEGRSPASLTAKILESDPVPILSLQPMAPAALDRLVATCLAKDPDNRFQSAHDFKLELEWIRDAAAESPQSAAPASTRWRRVLPWALSVVTALSFAVFAWVHGKSTTLQTEPVRFEIPLPTKPVLRLTTSFTLSPDGRQLAFAAVSTDGISRIWIRPLNSLEMRPLPGTESVGGLLIWSPDSRFIAFNSGGKLQKIDVSGGPAKFVCNLSFVGVGGSWSRNGVVLFGGVGGVIMRVSEDGGVATPVTVLDSAHGDVAHTNPYFLPDGRHFVYLRDTGSTSGAISVGSLDVKPEEQDPTRLVEGVSGPRYAPSSSRDVGQLLFRRGQTLMAQQFDAVHLTLKGDPLRVVEAPVGTWADDGHFSVSNDGILVYRSPTTPEPDHLGRRARQGSEQPSEALAPMCGLDLSRDGTAALVVRSEPNATRALLLIDLSSGTSTSLAHEPSTDYPGSDSGHRMEAA